MSLSKSTAHRRSGQGPGQSRPKVLRQVYLSQCPKFGQCQTPPYPDATLVFELFVQCYSQRGVHLRKGICTFTKVACSPAGQQNENVGPRFFGFSSRRCPPSRIRFPFCFELSTEAEFAKAAFDTLRPRLSKGCFCPRVLVALFST